MEIIRKIVGKNVDNVDNYSQAVELLKSGEVVAFPTETVYGLGAIATNDEAVSKIYAAKGRPSDNPLIVHIGTKEEVDRYVTNVSEKARKCIDAFWPGPLTIVCDVKENVLSHHVTAGLKTVGLRMPNHPVALGLLRALGEPLAAPSANRSGKPSPTEAKHVEQDLHDVIPLILDGGATGIGVESTVLDLTLETPTILRPGGITKDMISAVIGEVEEPTHFEQQAGAPKAPGMKYTHYSPEAPVYMIEKDAQTIAEAIATVHNVGKTVALLAPQSFKNDDADFYFTLGEDDQEQMAQHLYNALRACDSTNVDLVLATVTSINGVGSAIMNRLEKAAGERWFEDIEW